MQQALQQVLTYKTIPFYTQYQQTALHFLAANNQHLAAELALLADRNPLMQVTWHVDVNQIQLEQASKPQSILDDLRFQLHTTKQNHRPDICSYIIETLDQHGFLSYSIQEYCTDLDITEEVFAQQLAVVQQFEPFGIASKNSVDFLLKQLRQKQDAVSIQLLTAYSDQIVMQAWASIAAAMHVTEQDIKNAMQRIKGCAIYPCELEEAAFSSYIIPDMVVTITDLGLRIEPYQFAQVETIPPVELISEEWKTYFQEAKLFIDAFHHRNQTLLRVANELFKLQEAYFLDQKPLLPCRLQDISKTANLHISTISRAIQGKHYVYQGALFPLRTLVAQPSVNGRSKAEVLSLLSSYIKTEDKEYPYSDLALQQKFRQDGILLSRRAISKYRKQLQISSSYQRRRSKE